MSLNALAFLRRVLPASGYYAAFSKYGDRKYNRFFASVEELAQHIAAEDALGRTVYHACSTYLDPKGIWNARKNKWEVRTAENVYAVKSLWLDIDAGKAGSPYATPMAAIQALGDFCRRAHIRVRPACVLSGYGIHIYWPLTEDLGPDIWLEYATGLKGACEHFGLRCDPVRTADLASVLRTPGTHNRKQLHPVPVEIIGSADVGPYEVECFDILLSYGTERVVPSPQPLSPLTQALIIEPDYAPVYADEIANQCAQLRALRDTKGCTPEPHWYACLGVLSRCIDGQQKAHEWSSGYAEYSYGETQAKYDRTLALTGATTCAKFESVNHAGCQQCPLRGSIVSPISAGAGCGFVDSTKNTGPLPSASAWVHPQHDDTALPLLPAPFGWNRASQLICNTERGEQNVEILISAYPIYLVGVGVGEVRHDRFQLHFTVWRPLEGWSDLFISALQLMGAGGSAELAARGANIHDWKLFTNYVRAAIDQYHANERLEMHYDQCGWKDAQQSFLVGDCLYTSEGVDENVTVSQELATRAQWLGPQRGTLEGWSGAANALFASGCEAQSFALVCAFAAPLMRLQASDEGGAVVNLLSHGSGTGKTTALAGVYTAWGQKQGLSLTKIDTRVAQAITLGVLGNLPVIYDELGNRDPEVIREFIMMFTNGRDKMRGEAGGTIQHRLASWQTIMVTSSNLSVADLLAFGGGSDALSYRVLEFNCKLPDSVVAAKGDKLRKEMENNAGWAGDAFIDYLLQPDTLSWAKEALEKWTMEMWSANGNRPEHRFWMRTLGAVAVAGTLVNRAGILDFKTGRIINWALDALVNDHRVLNQETEKNRSLTALASFLSEHTGAVLVMPGPFVPGRNVRTPPIIRPQHRCFMRYEMNPPRLLIAQGPFRDWLMTKEIGSREVIDNLERIGLLVERRRYITLTAGTDLVGAQQSCIELDGLHPAISGMLAPVHQVVQDNALVMR